MEDSPDPLLGRVLDNRYRLDARIGAGGMGDVYRGLHLMMEHRVAIKLLKPDLAAEPTAAKRFVREAKSTSRLAHPNCVQVTDMGATEDGLMYLVMEYLDGRTVGQDITHDGPLAPERVMHIARQVCDALQCAHDMSFIHRDLKPENIMLIQRGNDPDVVKVLDFGLAKLIADAPEVFTALTMSPLTREGMIFGTPEYMSPEQAIDEPLTQASDLYSLGVVMYEMLTGKLPFDSDNYMEILAAHVREKPVPPHLERPELGIPESLSGLVVWLLAKSPAERPMSAARVSEDLAHLAEQRAGSVPGSSRISSDVAASATLDIDSASIESAAAEPTPAATVNARPGPARGRLQRRDDLGLESGRSDPLTSESQALPGHSQTAISAEYLAEPKRPARKRLWYALGGAALAVAAIVAAVAMSRAGDDSNSPPASSSNSAETDLEPTAPADRRAGKVVAESNPVRPAETHPVPGEKPESGPEKPEDEPKTGPESGDAERQRDRDRRRKNPRKRPSKEVKTHLEAAERARAAGNLLEQMAHADSALRLDSRSPEAAFLLGDALLASNRARACRYLRRAKRLRKARKAYTKAGCDSID